jgi:branched-chain amino acid transport system substrate-binding protein
MSKKLTFLLAALAVALAAGTTAGARPAADPGIDAGSILLGGSVPLSGLASGYKSVALGADAYFKYVNAKGGVNGRKISYLYEDDAYNPSQTVQATRKLVEQDKVFAIFNTLGTEDNIAIRDYLKQRGVPQLFPASGANTWGHDTNAIGFLPSYTAEGKVYGRYIAQKLPKAKIGILYQADDYTKDLIAGFKAGLGKKAGLIKAQQGYDVTSSGVASQIAGLKGAKVDTVMLFATPAFAIQAYVAMAKLGWKPPNVFINQVSSASSTMQIAAANAPAQVRNTISTIDFKDPSDPTQARDPGVKLYRSILASYGSKDADPKDVYNVYGMAVAYAMVDLLKRAGATPTRESVLNAAFHMNDPANPFVLKGIVVKTTPTDHFPIEQAQLERWSGGAWHRFGKLVSAGA